MPVRISSLLFVVTTLFWFASAFCVPASLSITRARTLFNPPRAVQNSPRLEPFRITTYPFSRDSKKTILMMLPVSSGTVRLLLTSSLQSGPYGVLGLWAIASAVVIPFSLYRQAYSFTVGYGYSVMAMAFVLVKVFGISPLLAAALFYGFRLGSFLLLRDILVPDKMKQMKKKKNETFHSPIHVPFTIPCPPVSLASFLATTQRWGCWAR